MGDDGQMLVERSGRVVIQKGDVSNSLGGPKFPDSEEVIELPKGENGTKLQHVHFMKAVNDEAQPLPDWRIAYDAMWVGIQGETAIREEKVIEVFPPLPHGRGSIGHRRMFIDDWCTITGTVDSWEFLQ